MIILKNVLEIITAFVVLVVLAIFSIPIAIGARIFQGVWN